MAETAAPVELCKCKPCCRESWGSACLTCGRWIAAPPARGCRVCEASGLRAELEALALDLATCHDNMLLPHDTLDRYQHLSSHAVRLRALLS